MDKYDELLARLDRLHKSDAKWQIAADAAAAIRELEADAKRYRWLRDRIEVREQEAMSGKRKPGLWVAMGMTFFDCNTVRTSDHVKKKAAELDAAIDAAMKGDSNG